MQLGRYTDALKSGQEWLEAVEKASGLGHGYVGQLQRWLETIVVEKLPNFSQTFLCIFLILFFIMAEVEASIIWGGLRFIFIF